jgi:hypothetical protein
MVPLIKVIKELKKLLVSRDNDFIYKVSMLNKAHVNQRPSLKYKENMFYQRFFGDSHLNFQVN